LTQGDASCDRLCAYELRKKGLLFLKKETKNFYFSVASTVPAEAGALHQAQTIKVFWFFSLEENTLSSS